MIDGVQLIRQTLTRPLNVLLLVDSKHADGDSPPAAREIMQEIVRTSDRVLRCRRLWRESQIIVTRTIDEAAM